MSLKISILPVTTYQQNCSILLCENTKKVALVDPGGETERILAFVNELEATVEKIFLTHGHLDHVGAAVEINNITGAPIEGPHIADKYWLDDIGKYAEIMQFPPAQSFIPDRWLEDSDIIKFGDQTLHVIHCPGHTPGHVVFIEKKLKVAMVGDVLFQGSIGRTDFPGGSHEALIHSITDRLFPLGDDIQFIPGHGPSSNFGHERRNNPFVSDKKFG